MAVTIKDGAAEALERTQERARGLAVDAASPEHDLDELASLRAELAGMKRLVEQMGERFQAQGGLAGLTVAVPTATEALERAQMDRERQDVRTLLAQQRTVPLEIPLEDYEQAELQRVNGAGQPEHMMVWRCQINGVIFNIRKGQVVEVPEELYTLYQRTRLIHNHAMNTHPAGINQPGYWVE